MKYSICILLILLTQIYSGPILDNLPITFDMQGPTTYNPDSGASQLDGYKLKVGYTGHSWLAVQFADNLKSDVLVFTATDFYTKMNQQFSGHQVLVTDYVYNSSVGLKQDKIIVNDISSFSYTAQKDFYLVATRFLGSNSGEDWNAATKRYSVQKVCFYTSDYSFDPATWNQGLSACYYFEIDNLFSKFVGKSLKSFTINGYTAKIYGWIDGPYLTDNVYIFQQSPLFTYTREPAFILELGETSGGHGQDFYVDSPVASESGDYHGTSVSTIKKDSATGGFENNGLSAKFWNAVPSAQITQYGSTGLRLMFSRNISSYDEYDKKLLSTFIFCLHIYAQGSISSQVSDKSCQIAELSYSYVRQEIKTSFSSRAVFSALILILALGII